ncbi:hypothetical protein C8F01DRAFT_1177730 [Mycena amicta]|nr:hypothetical protein C8F01DRAFT_1177730 [Mycena amicta]
MHPSLRRSALVNLPPAWRRAGYALFDGSGADPNIDLLRIAGALSDILHRPPWMRFYLPALYAVLETSDISKLQETQLEALGRQQVMVITGRVVTALGVLGFLAEEDVIPHEAIPEIWARAWPWINFLSVYEAQLPFPTYIQYGSKCVMNLVLFVFLFQRADPSVQRDMVHLDGLHTFVGQAWRDVVRHKDMKCLEAASLAIDNMFKSYLDGDLPEAEWKLLVAASGGSLAGLAQCMAQHLRLVYPHSQPKPATALMQREILGVRDILYRIFGFVGPEVDDETPQPFCAEFATQGGFVALTRACLSIALAQSTVKSDGILSHLLRILGGCFQAAPSIKYIVQSIKAGFLRAVCLAARRAYRDTFLLEEVDTLLHSVLPKYTVFPSVLYALADALEELGPLSAEQYFLPRLRVTWQRWMKVLQPRIQLALDLKLGNESIPLVCNNLECSKVAKKEEFKLCGRCHRRSYCSQDCQRVDYYTYDHRRRCEGLAREREGKHYHLAGTRTTFLDLLCNKEYERVQEDVALSVLAYFHRHPHNATWPCVQFDFTQPSGLCEITRQTTDTPVGLSNFQDHWRFHLTTGRAQMHAVIVGVGVSRAQSVAPYISQGPGLWRLLLDMVQLLPAINVDDDYYEQYREAVREMIAEEGMQTHYQVPNDSHVRPL